MRNQLNVGLVPPSDVLSLEAQQARQQQLLIEAENMADTTAMDFRRLVGLAADTPFELADRIDTPAARRRKSTRSSRRPRRIARSARRSRFASKGSASG